MLEKLLDWMTEFDRKVERNEATWLEIFAIIGVGAVACAGWQLLTLLVRGGL